MLHTHWLLKVIIVFKISIYFSRLCLVEAILERINHFQYISERFRSLITSGLLHPHSSFWYGRLTTTVKTFYLLTMSFKSYKSSIYFILSERTDSCQFPWIDCHNIRPFAVVAIGAMARKQPTGW